MFQAVINAVFPIFGLIMLGWFCHRKGLLAATATDALNRFVIYLALPALLYVAMARAEIEALSEIGFVVSYGFGTLLSMGLYIWLSRRHGLPKLARTINSMSCGYANSGYMGIPLILMVLGPDALAPAVIGAVMTGGFQFGLTIIAIEWQRAKGKNLLPAIGKVLISILKNPILVAPILGMLSAWSGALPPQALMGLLDLLANAATPCALLTIGLFLAQSQTQSSHPAVLQIVTLKLFVHPLAVGIMVLFVFDLDPLWAWSAILAAATPVGTGPFMLASLYREDAAISARAIFLSTLGSVVTLSLLVAWLNLQSII
jgi:predicted permease